MPRQNRQETKTLSYPPRHDPMYPFLFCVLTDWRDARRTGGILTAIGIEYEINQETNELFVTYINPPD